MKTWVGGCVGLFALFAAPLAQASVLVAPVEGTNLEAHEVEAISQTLSSAYQVAQTEPVVPLGTARESIAAAGGVREAAQKLSASGYVYATAVRLDSRIVITATLYTREGGVVQSAKMTANGLDDVELASERLAKALTARRTTAETRTIDSVTATEGRAPNRTWSRKITGFKSGVTYPIGWGHRISPLMSAGFALRVEGEGKFLEFGVGLSLPPVDSTNRYSYGGVYADIGANFYLTNDSTAPYLGFGVMPRLMSRQVTNLAPYAQAGYMFFREASTRLYIDLRAAQNVLPVGFGGSSQYDAGTGMTTHEPDRDLYPTELTLHLGIGW